MFSRAPLRVARLTLAELSGHWRFAVSDFVLVLHNRPLYSPPIETFSHFGEGLRGPASRESFANFCRPQAWPFLILTPDTSTSSSPKRLSTSCGGRTTSDSRLNRLRTVA